MTLIPGATTSPSVTIVTRSFTAARSRRAPRANGR